MVNLVKRNVLLKDLRVARGILFPNENQKIERLSYIYT